MGSTPLTGSGKRRAVFFPPGRTRVLTVTVTCATHHGVGKDNIPLDGTNGPGPRTPRGPLALIGTWLVCACAEVKRREAVVQQAPVHTTVGSLGRSRAGR